MLGVPRGGTKALVNALERSPARFYVQTNDRVELASLRESLRAKNLLGIRIFADDGPSNHHHGRANRDTGSDGTLGTGWNVGTTIELCP